MRNKQKLYKILLTAIVLYLCTFITPFIAFAQQDSFGNVESVTSVNDAIIKSILVISQVSALGVTFNHLFFYLISRKKNKSQYFKSTISQREDIKVTKRLTTILVLASAAIVASSTGLMLLQAYELSQNLSLDLMTAFSILYTTSVGQVWSIRMITAAVTTCLIFSIIMINKRSLGNKLNHNSNQRYPVKISRTISLTLLFGIIICISINLFSNSMVSHSNSLPSYPIIAVLVDWTHFTAVSIWIGGLLYLSTTFVKKIKFQDREEEKVQEMEETFEIDVDTKTTNKESKEKIANRLRVSYHFSCLLMYFSFVAIVSLGIIGLTGLYLSLNLLQSLNSLFTTTYGQTLIIKIGLALFMVFLGRYNQAKICNYAMYISKSHLDVHSNSIRYESGTYPKNSEAIRRSFNAINNSIRIESLIGVLVLVVASFLSVTSPPALEATLDPTSQNPANTAQNIGNIEYQEFFALVVVLSIAIIALGIINFKRNLSQIGNAYASTTT
jgi:copper transport protein